MNANQQFNESVDRFLKLQRRKRITSENRDITLMDLVKDSEPISIEMIKEGFDLLDQEVPESEFFLQQVREVFMDSIRSLNHLTPSRRLFAMETFSLIGNTESLAITTETLLFGAEERLKSIGTAYLKAFKGTDQVIQTLAKHPDLLSPVEGDRQLRALYRFRSDMAEKLLSLLKQDFVLLQSKTSGIDADLALDLVRLIARNHSSAQLESNMIGGEQLSLNLAKLIATIQGHPSMPIYGKTRFDFMKNFVEELSSISKMDGVSAQEMGKVVACFLYGNEQLRPPEDLIRTLIDEDLCGTPASSEALQDFLKNLAPTTIDVLLKDLRDFLQILSRSPVPDIEDAFAQARAKYEAGLSNEDSLIGRFHDTVMDMKVAGGLVIENLTGLITKLQSALTKTKKESGQKGIDELFAEVPESTDIEEFQVILRDQGAKERASEYLAVQTTQVGYRSAMADGGKRGASVNLQLFQSTEQLQAFKPAFQALFKKLERSLSSVVANEFRHPQATQQVQEYYIPFIIPMDGEDPLLFCVGIGYFEKEHPWKDNEEDEQSVADSFMDPYCFLMHTQNANTTMNARSRKIETDIDELQGKEFKSINLRTQAFSQACLSILLDLLHLIDEADWEQKEVQLLVAYLYKTLNLTPEYY